mmetsp:Transcript_19672/g.54893  ORF Transcript_19672/g.54893 Transcript_19672/m.54893 type:complete len:272 (-) Transcript_19672:3299-4114(-)
MTMRPSPARWKSSVSLVCEATRTPAALFVSCRDAAASMRSMGSSPPSTKRAPPDALCLPLPLLPASLPALAPLPPALVLRSDLASPSPSSSSLKMAVLPQSDARAVRAASDLASAPPLLRWERPSCPSLSSSMSSLSPSPALCRALRFTALRMCVSKRASEGGICLATASKPQRRARRSMMTRTFSLNLFLESSAQRRIPSKMGPSCCSNIELGMRMAHTFTKPSTLLMISLLLLLSSISTEGSRAGMSSRKRGANSCNKRDNAITLALIM